MKNKNGLPLRVIYCEECNISNQQPLPTNEYFHNKNITQETIKFDENNVCAACNFNKLKWNQKINWEEREKELIELCNKHRKTDGSYDCLIGGNVDWEERKFYINNEPKKRSFRLNFNLLLFFRPLLFCITRIIASTL